MAVSHGLFAAAESDCAHMANEAPLVKWKGGLLESKLQFSGLLANPTAHSRSTRIHLISEHQFDWYLPVVIRVF